MQCADVVHGDDIRMPGGWMPYLSVDSIVGGDDMDRYRVSLGLRREL